MGVYSHKRETKHTIILATEDFFEGLGDMLGVKYHPLDEDGSIELTEILFDKENKTITIKLDGVENEC